MFPYVSNISPIIDKQNFEIKSNYISPRSKFCNYFVQHKNGFDKFLMCVNYVNGKRCLVETIVSRSML